jgi:hypothetical protein
MGSTLALAHPLYYDQLVQLASTIKFVHHMPIHLANLMVQSELLARIKASQLEDPECAEIKQLLAEGKAKEFCLKEDELLTHFK